MRVYKDSQYGSVWHYEHVNLLHLIPGRTCLVPAKPRYLPSSRFTTRTFIDEDTIIDTDVSWDNLLSYLQTHYSSGFTELVDIDFVRSGSSAYQVYKTALAFTYQYSSGTTRFCCSFVGAVQSNPGSNGRTEGSWVCNNGSWYAEYFGEDFVLETIQGQASTDRWNEFVANVNSRIRFPRFFDGNGEQGDIKALNWCTSNDGWNEEDLPVDTQWTKPRSMLNMINAYTMTDAQMETFKKCLWYMDGNNMELSNKLYSNPMDCIIGAYFIPFAIPAGQVTSPDIVWAGLQNLKFYDTMEKEAVFPRITDEFVEYTLGVVNVERIFNDYRDFTEVALSLYLPCIGWKTLDAQTWMGYDMKIKYRVNFLTGEIIALIIMSDDDIIIDTCKGQCAQQVPISGRDFTNLMQAKLQKQGAFMAAASGFAAGALATVGGVISANPLVAGGGIAGMAGSVANGIRSGKAADFAVSKAENQVVRDGDIGGSSAILGYPKAFVLKAYHMDAMPQRYQNYQGYQANQILTVSTLTGYIKAREVYFSSARATEQEKTMVENALKEGVFR